MTAQAFTITTVGEADLAELLPLMRGYCDFYEVDPADDDLLAMARALLADPERQGVQLLARRDEPKAEAIGFATIFWSWSTLDAARFAVMNDLFVISQARGEGVADALIASCKDRAREHGARRLGWQTAKDNRRAQAVYERMGAERSEWLDYEIPL